MSLESIIYLSSAKRLLSAEDLRELLAVSRRNNEAAGIGGILIYWDGNFLQYVEGPPDALDALFERLERDDRHSGMIVMERKRIAARAFPDWTMAFEMMKTNADGQSDFLSDGLLSAAPEALSPTARRLLDIFREQLR